jgi:hypothetical protein
VNTLKVTEKETKVCNGCYFSSACYSPDGKYLATGESNNIFIMQIVPFESGMLQMGRNMRSTITVVVFIFLIYKLSFIFSSKRIVLFKR